MRKRFKNKRRACRLCKGNKRNQWHRWTHPEDLALKRFESGVARGRLEEI